MIWAVRDPIEKTEPIKEKGIITGYQKVIVDPGIEDKRLLGREVGVRRGLEIMSREGNTLTTTIRDAWDKKRRLENNDEKFPGEGDQVEHRFFAR